ncbi:hypothetical protein [Caldifermentibacillus hisashii]|uniref:hypothetical protein n=1 Tax=Caldifermentibacillus hisashii TaxID=996558 RepID=UPI0030EA02A9
MKSVKGLIWGTPEFVRIAKVAEREAEAYYEINNAITAIYEFINDCSFETYQYLRMSLDELFYE